MPFKEALFWFGITVFGTGLFFLVEEAHLFLSISLTAIGFIALAYSVYTHHYKTPRIVPLWVGLLIVTWIAIAYDVYDRQSNGQPRGFHTSWVPWAAVCAIALFSAALGYWGHERAATLQSSGQVHHQTKLGEISFDYLPDSPLNHGWILSEGTPPIFSSSHSGLTMTATSSQAMDYRVNPHERVCNFLKFHMKKSSHGSYVYAEVRMASKDGKTSRTGWLVCDVGDKPPKRISPSESVTYRIPLSNGWTPFDLSLRDEVKKSHFGQSGLEFSELLSIRFRGSLSVSPIELYREI